MLKGPIGGLNQKKKSISPKSFKKRCQNQSYKPLDSNRTTLIEPKQLDPTYGIFNIVNRRMSGNMGQNS